MALFLFRDKKKRKFHASNYIDKILVVTIVSGETCLMYFIFSLSLEKRNNKHKKFLNVYHTFNITELKGKFTREDILVPEYIASL